MASSLSKRLSELDKKKPRASSAPFPGQREPDDDRPMDGVVFSMMSLTGLLVLVVLGVVFGMKSIESGLEEQIRQDLAVFELADLEVQAKARDVLVIGAVTEEATIAVVEEYLAQSDAIMSYETNLRVRVVRDPGEQTVTPDPIVVSWTPSGAQVVGNTSTDSVREAIIMSLEDIYGSVDATGLTVKEGVAGERDWLTAIIQLAGSMRDRNPVGSIYVSPNEKLVQVTAEFDTRRERTDARQTAQDIISGSTTFDFTSALTYKDAPPPPKEEQVVELQTNIDELIEGKVVEFESNSDVITASGTALLDEILEALRQVPDVSIEIAGHTDDRGSNEYNEDLSRRRADAVLAYLVASGESPDRFVVVGYGESRPIADNATADGRARNRRIEFKALSD